MIRRGGILMEAVVAMTLLSLLTLSTGQALSLFNRQSRFLSQRAIAMQECHLALAQVTAIEPKNWDTQQLAAMKLPADAADRLPGGVLQVAQEKPTSAEEGSRIRVIVKWRPAPEADLASVELSVWRFDLPLDVAAEGAKK